MDLDLDLGFGMNAGAGVRVYLIIGTTQRRTSDEVSESLQYYECTVLHTSKWKGQQATARKARLKAASTSHRWHGSARKHNSQAKLKVKPLFGRLSAYWTRQTYLIVERWQESSRTHPFREKNKYELGQDWQAVLSEPSYSTFRAAVHGDFVEGVLSGALILQLVLESELHGLVGVSTASGARYRMWMFREKTTDFCDAKNPPLVRVLLPLQGKCIVLTPLCLLQHRTLAM